LDRIGVFANKVPFALVYIIYFCTKFLKQCVQPEADHKDYKSVILIMVPIGIVRYFFI